MNLIRIDARLRCTGEQAKAMVGVVDNVAFMSDAGFAQIQVEATSDSGDLLADTDKVLDRIQEALGAAGLSVGDVLDLGISTEALVQIDGNWIRRGQTVPAGMPAL